jgi:transcription initiation factor TFIIIB Brf1 subunit/transcription initiation factor TFIIB
VSIKILRKAQERNSLSGKDPRGIVEVAFYMTCIENNDKRI